MKRLVRVSYNIDEGTPLYPKTEPIIIKQAKSILRGDSCNTYVISLSNHTGTHIDFPNHFHNSGRKVADYTVEELIFKKPLVLDCPKGQDEPIRTSDLKGRVKKTTDLLLIRTGFFKLRGRKVYISRNPYILPETAKWLKTSCPRLRAIGIDCISVASPLHRQEGRNTHRALLGGKNPILIIEDVDLSMRLKGLKEVIAVPLYMEGIDSSPCTLIGVIDA
ncbi:MAG: cyclase family protein [Nitrospirae bacterium]|nr:cyclase family protein [Nitrospirota bacterium]